MDNIIMTVGTSLVENYIANNPKKENITKEDTLPPKITFEKDSKRLYFRFSSRIFIGKTQLENIKKLNFFDNLHFLILSKI